MVAEVLLLYEALSNRVTALYGLYIQTSPGSSLEWLFSNVSNTIYDILMKEDSAVKPSPPLAVSSPIGFRAQSAIFEFANGRAFQNASASALCSLTYQNWTGSGKLAFSSHAFPLRLQKISDIEHLLRVTAIEPNTTDRYDVYEYPRDQNVTMALSQSDIVSFYTTNIDEENNGLLAIVADQELKLISSPDEGVPQNPRTHYPYARLAWLNNTHASTVYFYHQLSDTLLAEDTYIFNAGWTSTNISIEL